MRATCHRQKKSFSCALQNTGFANTHNINTKRIPFLVKFQFNKHGALLKKGLRRRCLPMNFAKFIGAFKGHHWASASAIAIEL